VDLCPLQVARRPAQQLTALRALRLPDSPSCRDSLKDDLQLAAVGSIASLSTRPPGLGFGGAFRFTYGQAPEPVMTVKSPSALNPDSSATKLPTSKVTSSSGLTVNPSPATIELDAL